MEGKELKLYRAKLYRDASTFKKPDRISHASSFGTWRELTAGYKISETTHNWDNMEKAVRRFQEIYRYDSMTNYGTRNIMKVPEALGESIYYIDDERELIGVKAFSLCSAEELKEMAEDYPRFLWTKLMPRRFPAFNKDLDVSKMQTAYNELVAFQNYAKKMSTVMAEEYGLPPLVSPKGGFASPGIEFIFSTIRGIRDTSIDMRRSPDLLLDAIHAYENQGLNGNLKRIENGEKGMDMEACFDVSVTLLAHTIMNVKQWDKFYWPSLLRIINVTHNSEKTLRITIEGSAEKFFDYFKEYEKGFITFNPETDALEDIREALPNCAVMGGENIHLFNEPPETAIEKIKETLKKFDAFNGGFMLGSNKFPTYRSDADPDTLKAICDFIQTYRE